MISMCSGKAEHGNVEADTTKTLVNAFDFS